MILFVFEGERTEPQVYDTIRRLYFGDHGEDIIYVFNNNIYGLYNRIKREYSDFEDIADAAEVVSLLREANPDSELGHIEASSDIDQIFLFFDYDFQHAFHVHEQHPEQDLSSIVAEDNRRLQEMLEFFHEETEMGKLFINYPMVESLKYTKELPDANYFYYEVTLDECHGHFKAMAETFTAYHSYHGLLLEQKVDEALVRHNWELLKQQNVEKANFLCKGLKAIPETKEDIAQALIFQAQFRKFESRGHISILNSFPLFVFDYFKQE